MAKGRTARNGYAREKGPAAGSKESVLMSMPGNYFGIRAEVWMTLRRCLAIVVHRAYHNLPQSCWPYAGVRAKHRAVLRQMPPCNIALQHVATLSTVCDKLEFPPFSTFCDIVPE